MKKTVLAVYKRRSTLWKNANLLYHAQNWTRMECFVMDYTEEIEPIKRGEFSWVRSDGTDVTEEEVERRYGKPYVVKLINERRTNSKCFEFKTKDEANDFFKEMLHHKVFNNWKRV